YLAIRYRDHGKFRDSEVKFFLNPFLCQKFIGSSYNNFAVSFRRRYYYMNAFPCVASCTWFRVTVCNITTRLTLVGLLHNCQSNVLWMAYFHLGIESVLSGEHTLSGCDRFPIRPNQMNNSNTSQQDCECWTSIPFTATSVSSYLR